MIVFDTSALVGALTKRPGAPREALLHAMANDIFAVSESVVAEWMRVLHRQRIEKFIDRSLRDAILDSITASARRFVPVIRVADCRDPTDDMLLQLALASGAETIVRSDNDLLILHPWRGVRILTPRGYLDAMVVK